MNWIWLSSLQFSRRKIRKFLKKYVVVSCCSQSLLIFTMVRLIGLAIVPGSTASFCWLLPWRPCFGCYDITTCVLRHIKKWLCYCRTRGISASAVLGRADSISNATKHKEAPIVNLDEAVADPKLMKQQQLNDLISVPAEVTIFVYHINILEI